MRWLWSAAIIGWSVVAGAGASLAYILYRAAATDLAVLLSRSSSDDLLLIARRTVRMARVRLVAFSAYIVAAGALWGTPAPVAAELRFRLVVAHVAFIAVGAVAIAATFRDGMDILELFRKRQEGDDRGEHG